MEIIDTISSLPVQDPPEDEFSVADLTLTRFGTADRYDEVVVIPYNLVELLRSGGMRRRKAMAFRGKGILQWGGV
ncbi:unnamed protein product [Linum trigynum]|uniref:Uncharacterized protein n=1 Tax=Linum trigynum TaxID=586398 RepID=A0AAV2FWN0_9ROSI